MDQENGSCQKYLLEGNEKMSKLSNLKYYQLKIQPYLKSSEITTMQQKYLFLYRSRMINVGKNYGKLISCPLCKINEQDTQEHFFNCLILRLWCPLLYNLQNLNYEDVFSGDL